jgi:hypothetical protein
MWKELVAQLLQLVQQLIIDKVDLRPRIVVHPGLWGLTRHMLPLNQLLHFDQHL